MTNGRFGQTPPDKANKLFSQLLATSDAAVKTRERLLPDLKEELELLANLQEEHLFPILRQHGMQDLVRDTIADSQETGALLVELEHMPKNSPDFLGKVTELRTTFQQHLRDDKKELLPAVLKALSDEEAEAVAEQVEDDMANIDEIKRAEARRTREQGETVQRVTEDVAETLRAGVESSQTLARAMQEAVQNSFGAVSEMTRRSTDQAMQVFGRSDGDTYKLAEQASQNLRALAESGTALAHSVQDVARECVELSQKRLHANLNGLSQLARCRSMSDLVAIQTALIRSNLDLTLDNSRRLAELTIQMTDEATRSVTVQAQKTAQRISRVA